ncbi:MAG: hypothetical protein ACPGYL_02140, partial [Rhodospirillaceae bacterium]
MAETILNFIGDRFDGYSLVPLVWCLKYRLYGYWLRVYRATKESFGGAPNSMVVGGVKNRFNVSISHPGEGKLSMG